MNGDDAGPVKAGTCPSDKSSPGRTLLVPVEPDTWSQKHVVRPGAAFEAKLEMANDGFTRIMNPHDVEVVLRGRAAYTVRLDYGRGNRLWLPGPGKTRCTELAWLLPPNVARPQFRAGTVPGRLHCS